MDIPESLVATRRDELIKTGFLGLAPKPQKETVLAEKQPTNNEEELKTLPVSLTPNTPLKKEVATETKSQKLVHLTQSRATIPKRRLPSRRPHSSLASNSFFNNAQISEQEKQPSLDLKKLLIQAVISAEKKYRAHYEKGNNPREENGWFSWFRHGMTGQNRAEDFLQTIKTTEEHVILKKLDELFHAPYTKYNNHSFSSYLLDELKCILEKYKLVTRDLNLNKQYELSSWIEMKEKLKTYLPTESLKNDNAC